ncbi:hypothetical protein BDZ89DRAFT_1046875 [Hymenopellis radicata]|nr:hypothetical protein BDZ89DRAFT_1046875 [Hymenopellis radicata]
MASHLLRVRGLCMGAERCRCEHGRRGVTEEIERGSERSGIALVEGALKASSVKTRRDSMTAYSEGHADEEQGGFSWKKRMEAVDHPRRKPATDALATKLDTIERYAKSVQSWNPGGDDERRWWGGIVEHG